jgi:uncharacterized protein YjdB
MIRATPRLAVAVTVLGALALAACEMVDPTSPLGPDGLRFSLSPSELTLAVGESATISPVLTRSNGEAVNPSSLRWETSAKAIATVTKDGVITGVSPGNAQIIARSGNISDTTRIRIAEASAPRPGVDVSPDDVVLQWLGATATLTAKVRDDTGTLIADPGVTWKSLNPAIAQVNDMGVVSGKGVGLALIVATATCCGGADTAYARVQQVVDAVEIEQQEVSLALGSSVQLNASVLDRGGTTMDGTIHWTSANESVAQVSKDGIVTGRSAGTTLVTAASGDHSDHVSVSVTSAVASSGSNPRYPNEPAGFIPWFEHNWQSWPNNANQKLYASGSGMIMASHHESDASTAFTLVDDPTAPHGKGKSLRHRQRAGQNSGTTSGIFNLFNPMNGGTSTSAADQVRLRAVYRSHWVYFEPDPKTGDWQFGNTHMRTFWGNRHYGVSNMAVSLRSPETALDGRSDTYGGSIMWHSSPTTYYKSSRLELPVGRWHHHEYLWEPVGQYGVTDGMTSRIRAWIDGVLVIDQVITHTIEAPFANEHFAMVWLGGSGGTRAQDDFVRFGDVYISGIPYEH